MSEGRIAETQAGRQRPTPRRPPRREQVLGVLRAHEPELRRAFAVRSLALFGSLARGEAGAASDVDLLVEFDRPIGLLHLVGTAQRIEDILGRRVDLVLRRALLPQLRDRVLGEAELVF